MNQRKERKDASEHRRIILKKAQYLFNEHGVDEVNMHQIAKEAGIGQGTLYRKYSNKGELCLDLMKERIQLSMDNINQYLTDHKVKPVVGRLQQVCAYCIDFIEEQSPWLSAIKAPGCEENRVLVYRTPYYQFLHATFRSLLEEAFEQEGNTFQDATFTADAILAAMNPSLYLFLRDDRSFTKNEVLQHISDLYFRPLIRR